MPTAVIFRVYPEDEAVIALLPELPSSCTNPNLITCYQHIGQHGQADYDLVVRQTRPATDEETTPLLRELEGLGYDDLQIHQRRSPQMREIARREWREMMA